MNTRFKNGQKATMSMPVKVKSIDKENFMLTMVASTQTVDRHGDIVIQSGWDLKNFLDNPVILNSHNYYDATEVIARATRTEIVGKGAKSRLEQDWQFAVKENPKAKIIFDLYAGGFLSASSVGFIPTEFKKNLDGTTDWYTIMKAELLEVSAVSVPANARALAKAKGIEVEILGEVKELLDDDESNKDDDTIDPDDTVPAEILEDDGTKEVDGEPDADNGDSGESGSSGSDENDDDDREGDAEIDENDSEVETEEVINETEKTIAPAVSYMAKVADALKNIEEKERTQLRRASVIIQGLLSPEDKGATLDSKTQEQIRQRKINQAIRALLKTK